MSDTGPDQLQAADIRIVETREEIRLCFGAGRPASATESEFVVDTVSQIILTPPAAKRLSQVLQQVLAQHESLYGAVNAQPAEPSSKFRSGGKPSAVPANRKACADRLIGLIEDLGVFYEPEHSFKIFPGAILGDRVLLGFNHKDLGVGDTGETLLRLCRELGMPERFRKIYRERLPESNIILFGYEGNEQGGTWKAYLEFSGDYVTVAKVPGKAASSLLHLGFKWDAEDSLKAALARYTCYPELSVAEMLDRVEKRFYGQQGSASYEIVRAMAEHAAGSMTADDFLYMEVEEENNPRLSYDINMYRAGLPVKDFYSCLLEACRIKGISPEAFHELYEPVKGKIFGHVSGGKDREGRDFLTFYYGAAGKSQ